VRCDLGNKKFGSMSRSVPQEVDAVRFGSQVETIKCGAVRGQFGVFDVAWHNVKRCIFLQDRDHFTLQLCSCFNCCTRRFETVRYVRCGIT
jgi:hypothetical protein